MAKHNVLLTITSLLSILLMTFHLSDDLTHPVGAGTVEPALAPAEPAAQHLQHGTLIPRLNLRTIILGLVATTAFAPFEVWPRTLPRWFQRWVLQVVSVGVLMPITTSLIYFLSTPEGGPPFWKTPARMDGWVHLTFLAILIAPWTTLAAIVRQKEAFAREQKLAFALERSELERQALDARLHLLQAQVAPHFLFNTLANVQALVDAGSPQASRVLRSLVQYLRAAVPLLHEPAATIERELQLVRPYLELMEMRMPDRLQYAMTVDPAALKVRCPPTTLLTLVENAVRHGIDPVKKEAGSKSTSHGLVNAAWFASRTPASAPIRPRTVPGPA